jgi:short-subunit dehydrogenase
MELRNRQVLLTGATGGIGGAVAMELAAAGARLILVGRDPERLASLRHSLAGDGHSEIVADISTTDGRDAVVLGAEGADILINNAGVNHFGLFEDLEEARLRELMETNLIAPMLLCRGLLPQLTARAGAIVNIGSAFGGIGFPGYTAYSASKYGLRGFSEALRRELAGSVAVFYLAPRATKTAMNSDAVDAMNRELGNAMDSPEWVAKQLLQLLEHDTPVRYLGWPEKLFVRINGLLPRLVDRSLRAQLPIIRRYAKSA